MDSIFLNSIKNIGSESMDLVSLLIVFFTAIAFVITWILNRISILRIRKRVSQIKESSAVLQRTLDIDNSWVLNDNRRFNGNRHFDDYGCSGGYRCLSRYRCFNRYRYLGRYRRFGSYWCNG